MRALSVSQNRSAHQLRICIVNTLNNNISGYFEILSLLIYY